MLLSSGQYWSYLVEGDEQLYCKNSQAWNDAHACSDFFAFL